MLEVQILLQTMLQGIGGNNLKKLGLKSLFPLKEISIMGLLEVIPKIPKLISLISLTVLSKLSLIASG